MPLLPVETLFLRILGRTPDPGEAVVTFDLTFDDEVVAAQIAQSRAALAEPATTIRLYEAAFGAKPDGDGYIYWIRALQGDPPLSVSEMAETFTRSEEFLTRFALEGGRDALIEQLYLKVLDREPDLQGLDFWRQSLYAEHEILAFFSESAEFESRMADGIRSFFLDIALDGPSDPSGSDADDFLGSSLNLHIEIPPVLL